MVTLGIFLTLYLSGKKFAGLTKGFLVHRKADS